jgi:hypothetical protein
LRAAPDGDWVELDGAIGGHDHQRVIGAVQAMAADGVAELSVDAEGAVRARLPLA